MPCVKRNIVVLALMVFTAFAPKVAFAESSCECFCGDTIAGAYDVAAMTQTLCQKSCVGSGAQYVGCYTDPLYYPIENNHCWTKTDCDAWSDTRNGETIKATWDESQPYDCQSTKTSNDPMHYCYANDAPYTLNVSIGSVTTVNNLAQYINAAYTWILPAAALIAVVMMMIAGLQYVLARGKPKYIDKAKTRITNAITGMVLLLSVYVLVNLIDPRLTSLNTLRVPLIKEVTILDATSSCERLEDYGYVVEPKTDADSTEACGKKGKIKDDSALKGNVLGSWKLEDECSYGKCANVGETCLSSGTCATCDSVTTPSASVCSSLSAKDTSTTKGVMGENQIVCTYNADATDALPANSCVVVEDGGRIASGGTDGYYNCASLREFAGGHVAITDNDYDPAVNNGCEVYGRLWIKGSSGSGISISSAEGASVLQDLCNDDHCDLHMSGKDSATATGCYYTSSASATESGSEMHYSCLPVVNTSEN